MKKFGLYDALQGRFVAFYDTEAHGTRTLLVPPAGWVPPEAPLIPDPAWRMPGEAEAPLIPDPDWTPPEGVDGAVILEAPLIPDPAWQPPQAPMIPDPNFVPPEPPYYDEVPNPDCRIPPEAVPLDDDTWRDELACPGKYRVAEGVIDRNPAWLDPESLAEQDKQRIAPIKAAARTVILACYPEWKQANMTARSVELLKMQMTGALSPAEEAEFAELEAAWSWVKQVRARSDAAEAAGTQPQDIAWPD